MADQRVHFIHGVPSDRPELNAPSVQSLLHHERSDYKKNLFKNLEMCFQAVRNDEVLAEAIQRSFLSKPKTPYMMRMEKALCDLTNPQLTSGIFYCAVFKINEGYYVRYMDSGVFNGFFLERAFSKLKQYVADISSPYIADLMFWTSIFTSEDQDLHHEKYIEKLNKKRNKVDKGRKLRETGRRFPTLFETNASSFLPSHRGFMAQVSENVEKEESDCHLAASITCIINKVKQKAKDDSVNNRYIYCTGDFQNLAGEWETLLQAYRTESNTVSMMKTQDLVQSLPNNPSLHDQCKILSALSNFHYWEADVGFYRMLSVRDLSGKHKPASPRNRILLAFREHNYPEVSDTFFNFLKWLNIFDEVELPSTLTDVSESASTTQIRHQRRGSQSRRQTIGDILQNIGSIHSSYATQNQAMQRDLYEKFQISLIEDGQIHWRKNTISHDIVCMNDFDLYTGRIVNDKFIHLECLYENEIIEYRCNCELYSTLLQLASIGVPDLDIESNVDIQCCHTKFHKDHMSCFSGDFDNSSSKIANKILLSKRNQTPVVELTTSSNKTQKFSTVSEEVIGFVHLTNDVLLCQSGECQANYKQAKRKQENLSNAASICPHLLLMRDFFSERCNQSFTNSSTNEIEDNENDYEDAPHEDAPLEIVLDDDDDDQPKLFDPASGIWDFPSLSVHQPKEDGHRDLQVTFQKRMALADINGVLRDQHGYLWCNSSGPLSLTPLLPNSPDCQCGALYFNEEFPEGNVQSSPRSTCVIYTVNAPVKFFVYDRCCLQSNPACTLSYNGQADCIHLLSKFTGAGDEIGWDFVDKIMKSQITFLGYCDLMTSHYKRIYEDSAPFMSVNTFLDWWFSWASKFKIDFRQQCSLCQENPRMLACDGTKLGVRLRHASIIPIEKPTSVSLIDPCHRRNERAFLSFRQGDTDAKDKVLAREYLLYLCRKYTSMIHDKDKLSEKEEREKTHLLLRVVPSNCKEMFQKFCDMQYPPGVMLKLSELFKIMSTSHSLSSLVPFRFVNFLSDTLELLFNENFPNPSIINDTALFSPEVRDVLMICLKFPELKAEVLPLVTYIVERVRGIFHDIKEPDMPLPQPGTYNPPKNGMAYYFTKSGEKLRLLPNYTMNSDCHSVNYDDLPSSSESICQKKFPIVSRQGTTYLFLWFDPLHYGHCYGYHMIPGSEGRKDAFSSAYLHMPNAPEELFYDFSCQLEEYCLNREPGFFKNTRFFHDVFHGFTHKCPNVYKSKRLLPLRKVNTEICEQFNSFIQRIKFSARSMTMTRFNFYLQFMIFQWSERKRKQFDRRCNAAMAYIL